MEYPEEIYATRNGGTLASKDMQVNDSSWGRRHAYNIGCARGYQSGYEAGKAEQSDPLAGYSNLTAAISAGDPIDWEKLDGLVAKCVHPTLGTLLYPLEVDGNGRKVIWNNEGNFWFTTNGGKVWAEALREAWFGDNGWTLYVEGEIPLRRKTADQLKVGTYFRGKNPTTGREENVYRGGWTTPLKPYVFYTPSMDKSPTAAETWEVLEEHGPFQKPEGK